MAWLLLPPFNSIRLLMLVLPLTIPYASGSIPRDGGSSSNGTGDDLSALLAFKARLSDPLGVLAGNWTTKVSMCRWVGVSCSRRRPRVVGLKLWDVRLQGELTPHLGNLSFLRVLNLGGINLTGPIPADLGRLHRLRILRLAHNTMSDTIPSALGNLTKLEILNLYGNHISGHIPAELQNLHSLRQMVLTSNYLSGPVPEYLFSATPWVTEIHLGLNSLSGSIPDCVGSLPMLRVLALPDNQLSGPVPPAIFNMSSLEAILIWKNNLTGPIPTNRSFNLPMLQDIELDTNNFTGLIPSGLASCQKLEIISLSENLFSGVVPQWLAKMSRLTLLFLDGNELVGTIPSLLGNLPMLSELDLSDSNLSGHIPVELGTLTKLTYLDLSFNQLNGAFPAFVGNFSELTFLGLGYNQLTGPVPSTFGNIRPLVEIKIGGNHLQGDLSFLSSLCNCRQLQYLLISHNSFTGSLPNYVGNLSTELLGFEGDDNHLTGGLPATLSNLTNLRALNLSYNQLSDSIPASLMKLENLQGLDLTSNGISGPIPEEIGTARFVWLYLTDNKLSGSIPDSIGNLTMLQYISLSDNKLSSTIPTSLFYLGIVQLFLSNNNLNGTLPSDLSHIQDMFALDTSDNLLVGQLPNSFGYHQMLAYLNLSHNSFTDSIPNSISHLTSLEVLDLSYNNLSGTIPKYLANFTYLTTLNLSSNKLKGEIPNGGVFSNITLISLMGNAALCGLPRLGFLPCLDKSHSTNGSHYLKFILPAITIAVGALALCLYQMTRKKIKRKLDITTPTSYRLVSYQEIVRATESFNEDNMLGAGSFGKVYKGHLDDGMVVAIKVLNMQEEQAMRSFDVECQVLRMVRHRNLIRILNICSNLDFKALLLQYMPNGSLETYLHKEGHPPLGFLKRLDIMLDVSMAMEHLHYHHSEVVLHCDLKPSNVLFDEEMTAHVADFGIAKLLLGDDNSAVSASMPGTIGYMAPEYVFMGKASRKSDVFSYGIMLLEVFTGKRPTDAMFVGDMSLRKWVSEAFPARPADIVDGRLLQAETLIEQGVHQNNATSLPRSATWPNEGLLLPVFELGLMCCSSSPAERMEINDVVVKLKSIRKDYFAFTGAI
uniref:non-specific serine/threonine protein kinase n=1 Tax=Oryza rufipogon TaxID=4529 RepID=A0A679BEE6_ORYRU|nr:putative receptor kinase TRKc [Oryza rufipogon]